MMRIANAILCSTVTVTLHLSCARHKSLIFLPIELDGFLFLDFRNANYFKRYHNITLFQVCFITVCMYIPLGDDRQGIV